MNGAQVKTGESTGHHAREETKMPYRITKEGNVSHTARPALQRSERVTIILAVLTAVVLILTL
jgi:hypothetical protein